MTTHAHFTFQGWVVTSNSNALAGWSGGGLQTESQVEVFGDGTRNYVFGNGLGFFECGRCVEKSRRSL
eukprot:SAG22_NODE_789_length_7224_cov_2.663953_2_plen_68_part_00